MCSLNRNSQLIRKESKCGWQGINFALFYGVYPLLVLYCFQIHPTMCIYTHLLLVEDDPDDQDFFQSTLKEVNDHLSFLMAQNAIIAKQWLKSLPPLKTLIFLDLNLPIVSGLEFLQEIKKEKLYQQVPVAVLTTSKADANPCKEYGADLYVVKPSSCEQFHYILSVILNNDVKQDCNFVQSLLDKDMAQRQRKDRGQGEWPPAIL